jgi:putative hydrolase of the HAD superfamily
MQDPSPIAAVLFDLDGTLVDHRSAVAAAFFTWLSGLCPESLDRQDELFREWWALERRHMQEYLSGACSFAEQRRRRLRAFLPMVDVPVGDDEALDVCLASYVEALEAGCKAFDDAHPCLRALASTRPHVRRAVLTNGDAAQQRRKIENNRLGALLDAVFVSEELGAAKPDRRAFLEGCAHLGCRPSETLYVGDTLDVDALAACAAGLRGVWLDRAHDCAPCVPAVRITSLYDLEDACL